MKKHGGKREGSGRKSAKVKRNKSITISLTEEELKEVREVLKGFEGTQADRLLKIIRTISKHTI